MTLKQFKELKKNNCFRYAGEEWQVEAVVVSIEAFTKDGISYHTFEQDSAKFLKFPSVKLK